MSALTPIVAMSALLAALACLVLGAGLFVTGRRKKGLAGLRFDMLVFSSVALAAIGILLLGLGA